MSPDGPVRVCFVCSGNICRSPIAEVVLRAGAADRGLAELIEVDSAGTDDWHIGEHADRRAVAVLAQAGYDGTAHRARQFDPAWFAEREFVVALDRGHQRILRAWAATPQEQERVHLLRSFDPGLTSVQAHVQPAELDVHDPYYDGQRAFVEVLAQIEAACRGLLDRVQSMVGIAVAPIERPVTKPAPLTEPAPLSKPAPLT